MKTSCKAHQAQVHAGERELLQMDGNHEDVSGEQAKRDQMRDEMGWVADTKNGGTRKETKHKRSY